MALAEPVTVAEHAAVALAVEHEANPFALGASSKRSTNGTPRTRTRARRWSGPRPELAPIAAELRALMRSGASLPVAASKLGMDADRAREVLAEWPASFVAAEPSRRR